ncbi:histidinol-phosphate transaminase [Robertkochia aurantiaca]|uniref:histidinol-phosphate transaminase n=1 Tax=Robertkochia aurantiaca TaxID=2873700 RepID=UPI001CCBA8E0|nr:histidinol-phosphate transaminase [Robertkochia sp. 3YJGBD-33]
MTNKTIFDPLAVCRENVKKLSPYSSARDEFSEHKQGLTFIDANENPYGDGLNRYPDPYHGELKEKLSVVKEVPAGKIFFGNGSDEVLDLLFRAFAEPGSDNVITLPPTYGMYKVLAGINNVENREVQLLDGFQIDTEKVLKSIDEHTKMIFICSPNNPSGNLMSENSVKTLLENFNGLVVIDEAYIDFTPADSWSKALSEYANLVVTQTFSKAYGLAGIRLGILYASPEIIGILNKIKPPYNVNSLSANTAMTRLENIRVVQDQITEIVANREQLIKALLEVDFVTEVFPSDANFILARVDDATLRYRQLLDKGIVVRDRSSQVLCEETLRFTVGTTEENQKLLKALQELKTT